jgi:hypothetical protein
MSMYVELLSAVLADGEAQPVRSDSPLDVAVECRHRMLDRKGRPGGSIEHELADEVAYDRALVNLCAASGIDVDPRRFSHPRRERARLESALVERGVDFDLARHRRWPRSS